jgi:hypothetical protein
LLRLVSPPGYMRVTRLPHCRSGRRV